MNPDDPLAEFGAIPVEEDDPLAEFGAVEALPAAPGPTQGEAFSRGLLRGATFDFDDEAAGALDAIVRPGMFDDLGKPLTAEQVAERDEVQAKPFGERMRGVWKRLVSDYEEGRDEARASKDEAAAAHPWTTTGGAVLGSLAPLIMTGGASAPTVGGRIATSAALGGVQGVGGSKQESLEGVAQDAGTGALVGGAFGAGGEALGAGFRALGRSFGRRGAELADEAAQAAEREAQEAFGRAKKTADLSDEVLAARASQEQAKRAKGVLDEAKSSAKANPKQVHVDEAQQALNLAKQRFETLKGLRRLDDDVQRATREAWNARSGWDEQKLQQLLPAEARAYVKALNRDALHTIRDHGLTPQIEAARRAMKAAEKKLLTSRQASDAARTEALGRTQRAERVFRQSRAQADSAKVKAQPVLQRVDAARQQVNDAGRRTLAAQEALEHTPENMGSRLFAKAAHAPAVPSGAGALTALAPLAGASLPPAAVVGGVVAGVLPWALRSPRAVKALETLSRGSGATATYAGHVLRDPAVQAVLAEAPPQQPPTQRELEEAQQQLDRALSEAEGGTKKQPPRSLAALQPLTER